MSMYKIGKAGKVKLEDEKTTSQTLFEADEVDDLHGKGNQAGLEYTSGEKGNGSGRFLRFFKDYALQVLSGVSVFLILLWFGFKE